MSTLYARRLVAINVDGNPTTYDFCQACGPKGEDWVKAHGGTEIEEEDLYQGALYDEYCCDQCLVQFEGFVEKKKGGKK